MHPSENNRNLRSQAFDPHSHRVTIREARCRGGKADQIGMVFENPRDMGIQAAWRTGPQAIVHKDGVPALLQESGNRKQAQGSHAVGRGGHIFFAGDPVGAGRMNQDDAHLRSLSGLNPVEFLTFPM
jgi:hypothetical protein